MNDKILSLIHACFDKGGWLERELGYVHEPAQHSYAVDVTRWLWGHESTSLGFIEGGTGCGKSLGYLVPVLLRIGTCNERACIATQTIALQDQLLKENTGDVDVALRFVAEMGFPVPSVCQLIGKQGFIDADAFERHVNELVQEGHKIEDHEFIIQSVKRWAELDGRYETYIESHGDLPEPIDIRACTLVMHGSTSEAYELQRQRALESDLVITSHTMLLINRSGTSGSIFESSVRPLHHVVIDEADMLPKSAAMLSSKKMRPDSIVNSFADLLPLASGAVKKLIRTIEDHANEMQLILKGHLSQHGAKPVVLNSGSVNVLSGLVEHAAICSKAAKDVIGSLECKTEIMTNQERNLLVKASDSASFLDSCCNTQQRDVEVGVSWSAIRKSASLHIYNPFPGRRIKRYFMGKEDMCRVMFTSATISNGMRSDSFPNFKSELQVFGSRFSCVESTHEASHFGRCEFVLMDSGVRKPVENAVEEDVEFSPQWITSCANMISMAGREGPTLCLTNSHRETRLLAKSVAVNGTLVRVHEPGVSVSEVLKELELKGGVMMSASVRQGFSVRKSKGGQLFRNVVISRIPFKPPAGDFERSAVISYLRQGGMTFKQCESLLWGMTMVDVVRKLRQGMGRLIRNREDEGKIWFCDPRMKPFREMQGSQASGLMNAIPKRFMNSYREAEVFDVSRNIVRGPNDAALSPPLEIPAWL